MEAAASYSPRMQDEEEIDFNKNMAMMTLLSIQAIGKSMRSKYINIFVIATQDNECIIFAVNDIYCYIT